jgi:hypothetical protein
MKATIIIPCAPHHESLLPRAVKAVENQTVPTKALTMLDTDKRGPGWIRNELLKQVDTEYVGFCDADDWLEPDFVESCIPTVRQGVYAYTDWWLEDRHREATDYPWLHEDDWHLINVLLLTIDARRIGPFDHTLAAMEDTDWFLKAALYDICGQRVAKPLVHYTKNGQRSQQAIQWGQMNNVKLQLRERYAYKMGCCGHQSPEVAIPQGERQPGDVLAMARWKGNHVVRGKATGRRYPRMSWPKTAYVDPRDIERDPRSWRAVEKMQVAKPDNGNGQKTGVAALADAVIQSGIINPPPKVESTPIEGYTLMNETVLANPYTPTLADAIAPDYARLVELGRVLYVDR